MYKNFIYKKKLRHWYNQFAQNFTSNREPNVALVEGMEGLKN